MLTDPTQCRHCGQSTDTPARLLRFASDPGGMFTAWTLACQECVEPLCEHEGWEVELTREQLQEMHDMMEDMGYGNVTAPGSPGPAH